MTYDQCTLFMIFCTTKFCKQLVLLLVLGCCLIVDSWYLEGMQLL